MDKKLTLASFNRWRLALTVTQHWQF